VVGVLSCHVLAVLIENTTQDICGQGFHTLACSALIESGLWSEDAVKHQVDHKESNRIRVAYNHKTKHLKQRHLMLQWLLISLMLTATVWSGRLNLLITSKELKAKDGLPPFFNSLI